MQIGITERGDAFFDTSWEKWVFEEQKPAILITKNPTGLIKKYPGLFIKDNCGKLTGNVILHATITGLGGTPFEPNVTPPQEQIDGLKGFLNNENFCKERIVIRQDPIFPTFILTDKDIHNKLGYGYSLFIVRKFVVEYGLRYRISFFDFYPHVKERIMHLETSTELPEDVCINYSNLTEYVNGLVSGQPEFHLSLELRKLFYEGLKREIKNIEVCGEPGLPCTGCLSQLDLDTFGISLEEEVEKGFQRPACACLGIKHELLKTKHPCKHHCVYCFWKD